MADSIAIITAAITTLRNGKGVCPTRIRSGAAGVLMEKSDLNAHQHTIHLNNKPNKHGGIRYMNCAKCGTQMGENERFCGACGAPVGGQSLPANPVALGPYGGVSAVPTAKPKNYKRIGIIACGIVAVFVAVVIIFAVSGGGGYKSVIDKYYKAIETTDANLYYSILAPEYVDYMVGPGNWYSTTDDFKRELKDQLKDKLEGYEDDYGKKIKIKVLSVEEEKLTERQITKYTENIYSYFNFSPKSVQGFVKLKLQISATGTAGTGTYTVTNMAMVKTKGKWHMMLGSLE
jgi:hypothetical protein